MMIQFLFAVEIDRMELRLIHFKTFLAFFEKEIVVVVDLRVFIAIGLSLFVLRLIRFRFGDFALR